MIGIVFAAVVAASSLFARDLQKEIDDLAAAGGGTLALEAGEYKTGALFFKPGVNLHLAKGATIVGVDDEAGYPKMTTRIEGETCEYYPALINADGCDGFTITGEGTVDGHGANTWEEFWIRRAAARAEGKDFRNKWLMRPRVLYVSNSKNVTVKGVTFKNSKFWTTHYYNCENVLVEDCTILAEILKDSHGKELKGPSTDAVDIDKCRDFTVRGCTISVNDDGVAVKGGKGPWADDYAKHPENGPSSNVIVEKCVFKYPTHSAVTLGSECPECANVVFRDSTVEGVGNMLCIKMRTDTPQHYSKVLVDNVTGYTKMFLSCGAWSQYEDIGDRTKADVKSYCDDVTMRNCRIKCDRKSNLKADPERFELTNYREENCEVEIAKKK